jgi:uncharacterized protein YndB with AHSA1/START domain
MPKEKDLKRLVRARMQKTGESYTAARLQLLKKDKHADSTRDLATVAGMSDASVSKKTGRTWAEWVRVLDAADATQKTHREIAEYVSSLGTPSWWTQMVTVGYERIRGLRERGQQRSGGYQITKSRTFKVSVARLFAAFTSTKLCSRWLPKGVKLRSMTANKRIRLGWPDGTQAVVGFVSKGAEKSIAAVQHEKLADRQAADAMKKGWGERFDTLGDLLA